MNLNASDTDASTCRKFYDSDSQCRENTIGGNHSKNVRQHRFFVKLSVFSNYIPNLIQQNQFLQTGII